MRPFEDMDEGSFTGTGMDLLAQRLDPRPATTHVAVGYTVPPRGPWWKRALARLGLADD